MKPGAPFKAHMLQNIDHYLLQLEAAVQKAGGQVHWAADAAEANQISSLALSRPTRPKK